MKSDFVSTVSHELRTPLTRSTASPRRCSARTSFGEEERSTFLRYIASESERLTAIVDRLLSVAQLDTGDIAVQLAETDVGAVVSEAVRSAEGADGGENGHRFVVRLADEPLAAEADRDKLQQVLHLLDNAVRLAGGRHRHRRRPSPRRGRGERRGRGRRHSARRAGADLPQVLPRRRGGRNGRRGRRWPRPLPRRGSRHGDGRQDQGRLERGKGSTFVLELRAGE